MLLDFTKSYTKNDENRQKTWRISQNPPHKIEADFNDKTFVNIRKR